MACQSAVLSSTAAPLHWEASGARQPALNTWDENYHGAVWTEAVQPLGPIVYIIRARVILHVITVRISARKTLSNSS
ncbi:MAG: hypothetical protein QGH07_16325 [Alphaproteobacteria bacterium]|jgi:O-acetylhomoserine/O-acetylserine sulfhydrylase-like pyridoxal-dependent enzyme|nr:hypothetical protein [Alphaproteobacteria bacterium]MEC8200666.1 hypothetical protein [Pseudomonadota bacterium]